jgi:hypothetical protein
MDDFFVIGVEEDDLKAFQTKSLILQDNPP